MTADPRWEQVKQVFQAALDREPQQRAAFLRDVCGADAALQAEVESLLDAHERAGSFAEGPAMSGRALGETFGPYQITGWLGCGAMGEVYRARDRRLNRDVALKLLPQLFAFDAERLARFTREAQMLASLNHQNIATIHGLEQAGGRQALVLELIDGPTLADRIQQGPIPSDEVLSIARQIGEALEAAHEQGIIHRDLKPSNIKLRPDGVVKVLDFGLAKAMAPAPAVVADGKPPTLAAGGTREGVIVGTIAYMSPEQARGKAVDKRTDIWAFGCVIYEMLTGTPAFAGDDAVEMLSAIVRGAPAWEALPAGTPPNVSNLLRRCLTKNPHERLRDIGDARLVMDGAFGTDAPDRRDAPSPAPQSTWRLVAIAAAAALICSLASGFLVWSRMQPAPSSVARFTIPLGAGDRFYYRGRQLLAMSDDGRTIVYSANQGLYLRRLDQLDAVPVPGTEGGGRSPFLSPDGRQIGFWINNQLKSVAVSGGAPVTLSSRIPIPWGISWESDNTILVGEGAEGIWRVPGSGGEAEVVIRIAAGELAHGPHLLPGGEWVLFTLLPKGAQSWSEAQIVAHSLRTNERRVLIRGGHDARYVRTGHLLYAVNEALMAVGFDANSLRVLDSAVKVVEPVADADGVTGASQFSATPDGALLYIPTIASPYQHALTWVDREGREEPIPVPVRAYMYPRISPDGTRVAVDVRDQDNDIWIWDIARKTLTRLTFDPGSDGHPAWTPDGRQIAFMSERDGSGLFVQAADGSGPIERLTSGEGRFPSAFSSDGMQLLFWGPGITRNPSDIGMIAHREGARPSTLVQTESAERNAELSPDGRWIAYQSDESGQTEVYVRPFPNIDEGRWQVSTGGGERPLWARSGRELFYVGPNGLMEASVESTPTFRAGASRLLFDNRYFLRDPGFVSRTYDISPDGNRFLLIKDAQKNESPSQLVLVLNWPEELKRLVTEK